MSKETTQELLERGERYGFEVSYDSGFAVVRRPEIGDPERTRNIVEELGARVDDVASVAATKNSIPGVMNYEL